MLTELFRVSIHLQKKYFDVTKVGKRESRNGLAGSSKKEVWDSLTRLSCTRWCCSRRCHYPCPQQWTRRMPETTVRRRKPARNASKGWGWALKSRWWALSSGPPRRTPHSHHRSWLYFHHPSGCPPQLSATDNTRLVTHM